MSAKGFCSPTISSRPVLAWKPVSMSAKAMMEPSAPPPLCRGQSSVQKFGGRRGSVIYPSVGEKLMASWKVNCENTVS